MMGQRIEITTPTSMKATMEGEGIYMPTGACRGVTNLRPNRIANLVAPGTESRIKGRMARICDRKSGLLVNELRWGEAPDATIFNACRGH